MTDNSSAEARIMGAFRQLATTLPLEKVTVSALCEQANVSRRTFYTYFESKDVVLERVFHDDTTSAAEALSLMLSKDRAPITAPLLTESIYRGIYDHRDFYQHLASQSDGSALAHVMQKCFENLHVALSTFPEAWQSDHVRMAACYGAGGQTAVIMRWIREGMTMSPQQLAEWTSQWGMESSGIGFSAQPES